MTLLKELRAEPWKSVQKVENFLNLEPFVSEKNFVFNEDRGFFCVLESRTQQRCLSSSKGRKHIEVSEETKLKLRELYRNSNKKFFDLVKHDFGWND